VQAAPEIARAHPTVVALSIGLEDYTASIGAVRSRGGRESQWARSIVVAAARAAGVQPLDSVFSDVDDLEGLAASVEESKSMGFEGSGSIHPRQIATIHDGYGPSAEELVRAKAIVRAYEEAASRGIGVVALGSKMIDPPVVKRAERSVELAVRTGKLPRAWRESDA
jgi:citrate lyase subunit beta/citryl-CoA lyase